VRGSERLLCFGWPRRRRRNDIAIFSKRLKLISSKEAELRRSVLYVWGSGDLIQTLLRYNLIDQMHLFIYPLTIGMGKKLFAEGTQPANFKLVDSKIGSNGVIFATYEPTGELKE